MNHGARVSVVRAGPWIAACLVALGCLAVAAHGPARSQVSGAGDAAPADTFRVFEADLGPAWIDVNAYPPEQQEAYALFAQKCSKCHTLARPINSAMRGDEWTAYVGRMSRKAGSGISPKDGDGILRFLIFDSQRRARAAGAVDPELVPFLRVSQELCAVRRFPASKQDIRAEEGLLRVAIDADPRLDLSRFFVSDDGQRLVKWTARTANRGELVLKAAAPAAGPKPAPVAPAADEAVRRAAAEAVGSAIVAREKAERILDWLDEKVARQYRQGTASPAAILAERRGDATEFTRLFVAMAGACGLPARSRVGFVARRTGFFLHTWAEVWLEGWTPVDPYLGQLPADLAHLRLVTAGADALTGWDARRMPGLDRLELRVIETAKPAKGGG